MFEVVIFCFATTKTASQRRFRHPVLKFNDLLYSFGLSVCVCVCVCVCVRECSRYLTIPSTLSLNGGCPKLWVPFGVPIISISIVGFISGSPYLGEIPNIAPNANLGSNILWSANSSLKRAWGMLAVQAS